MTFFLFICLLGLAGVTGRLWLEVQALKAQAFLRRIEDSEAATVRYIRATRLDAERRMREAGER